MFVVGRGSHATFEEQKRCIVFAWLFIMLRNPSHLLFHLMLTEASCSGQVVSTFHR